MRDYLFRTRRFNLREFMIEDAEHLYKLNADPEVIKYTGDRPFSSVDDARIFIQNYDHYSRFGYGRWAVLTEASTFLGWCGLRNDGMGNVDLGFRIFRSYWSQGIATECGHACLRYGFKELGLHHVYGRASVYNPASFRVLEKIGMKFIREEKAIDIGKIRLYEIENQMLKTSNPLE